MNEPFSAAVGLVEDGLALAKQADATAWCIYLAGVVPFFGFLLFALTDLFQRPFAVDNLMASALILAVLFYWLHICQAAFCGLLYATLTESQRSPGKYFSAAFRGQPVIAGVKLLAWPVGLLLVVPHSTVTSFFQHSLLAAEAGRNGDWRATLATARDDVKYRAIVVLWTLVIVLLLRGILWLNLLSLLFFLPQLWKIFTGIEGNVTRAPEVLFNPTSIAALCALAYIGLDPIVKAVFVLRRFARRSETSGDDLRLRLALARKTATVVLVLALFLTPASSFARQQSPSENATSTVTPDRMKQAIQSVFRDPSNTWNLPAVQHRKRDKDAFTTFMDSLANQIDNLWKSVTSAVSSLIHWIRRIFSNSPSAPGSKEKPVSTRSAVSVLASLAGLLLMAALVAAFRRAPKRPKLSAAVASIAAPQAIDLMDEADPLDQPINEWHKLAHQYRANGDFRLTLRALYLGNLATLAAHDLISPARGKTNSEYIRELRRRSRRLKADFVPAFAANTQIFERSWYGTYPATIDTVQSFEDNLAALEKHLLQNAL